MIPLCLKTTKNNLMLKLYLLLHGEEKVGGYDDTLNLLRDQFDYELLHKVTKVVTRNLNNVIDINFILLIKQKIVI